MSFENFRQEASSWISENCPDAMRHFEDAHETYSTDDAKLWTFLGQSNRHASVNHHFCTGDVDAFICSEENSHISNIPGGVTHVTDW
jgi:hypothetical protein